MSAHSLYDQLREATIEHAYAYDALVRVFAKQDKMLFSEREQTESKNTLNLARTILQETSLKVVNLAARYVQEPKAKKDGEK